jgi:hypothetical protein
VLRWSQPLVRLPLAEVVASAVGTISHLLLSPQLFGFNGLVVTPHRRTGVRTYSQ